MSVATVPDLPELPDLKPEEIPPFVTTAADLQRWKLCVALTREIANRDDWRFAIELYEGEIPTDSPEDTAAS